MGMSEPPTRIYMPRARHVIEEISDDGEIDWRLDDGSSWNRTLNFSEEENSELKLYVSPWESLWELAEETAYNHVRTQYTYRHSSELMITKSDVLKIVGEMTFKGLVIAGIGLGFVYLFLEKIKDIS